MKQNAPKIILAALLFVAALGLILWNAGAFDGGGGVGDLDEGEALGVTDQEELNKINDDAAANNEPNTLQGLKKVTY